MKTALNENCALNENGALATATSSEVTTEAATAMEQSRRPASVPALQPRPNALTARSAKARRLAEAKELARLQYEYAKARLATLKAIDDAAAAHAHVPVLLNEPMYRVKHPNESYSIALAALARLRAIPKSSDAPRDICIFASRVNNIVATLRALDRPFYLYNPELTMITVAAKSCPPLRDTVGTSTQQNNRSMKRTCSSSPAS